MSDEKPTILYRYDSNQYSVAIDAEMGIFGSSTRVELREFKIIKYTPKGFWIERFMQKPKFVLASGKNDLLIQLKKRRV